MEPIRGNGRVRWIMTGVPTIISDDPARFVFAVDSVVFARTESSYDLAHGELDSNLCSGS